MPGNIFKVKRADEGGPRTREISKNEDKKIALEKQNRDY